MVIFEKSFNEHAFFFSKFGFSGNDVYLRRHVCNDITGMVSEARTRFALAPYHRSVRYLAERDYLAADTHPTGLGVLGAVYETVANGG